MPSAGYVAGDGYCKVSDGECWLHNVNIALCTSDVKRLRGPCLSSRARARGLGSSQRHRGAEARPHARLPRPPAEAQAAYCAPPAARACARTLPPPWGAHLDRALAGSTGPGGVRVRRYGLVVPTRGRLARQAREHRQVLPARRDALAPAAAAQGARL